MKKIRVTNREKWLACLFAGLLHAAIYCGWLIEAETQPAVAGATAFVIGVLFWQLAYFLYRDKE